MSVKYTLNLNYVGLKDINNKDLESGVVPVKKDEKQTVIFNSYKLTLSLHGIIFNRKIYEPGHIQAEILIFTEGFMEAPSISCLSEFLIHRRVSLLAGTDVIASDYYIQEISPQYEAKSDKRETGELDEDDEPIMDDYYEYSIYTKLDIYSPDNLFTLNKFSRAYLGMRLCGDIVRGSLSHFPVKYECLFKGENHVENPTMSQDNNHKLTNLAYTDTVSKNRVELIHPYLVQYNESFHDFLKRTANRCGEVFFYEGGKLCFGLEDIPKKQDGSPDVAVISGSRVVFSRISDAPLSVLDHARDAIKEYTDSSYAPPKNKIMTDPVEKGDDGLPNDAYPTVDSSYYTYRYNSEIASEDHYTLLFKDKFARDAGYQIWFGEYDTALMSELSEILNSKSLMEVISRFTTKTFEAGIAAGAKRDDATKKGNDKVIESAIDNSKDYAVLFAFVDSDKSHWITLDYYSDIRKHGQEQMQKIVCIDMGEEFVNKKLGDYIKIPHDDSIYVVVQIDITSDNIWQRNYDGYFGDGIHLKDKELSPTQYLYAIPLKGEKFYPPVLPGNPFRQSGPQPAFVIENKDPLGQGRVRIRYPWQPEVSASDEDLSQEKQAKTDAETAMKTSKETLGKYATDIKEDKETGTVTATKIDEASNNDFDNALKDYKEKCIAFWSAENRVTVKEQILQAGTPWIRMATPMATPGGGVYFRPEVGDEVMVDFENGNIERPFVISGLFSKNSPAPYQGSRVIVSRNGHTIKMTDPIDGALLAGGILPGFKYLSSCGVEIPTMTGDDRRLLGGIELTDRYGIYNIKMSSHNRNITIASPFGDIQVNAFTGIKINAPNGNIKIVGKNVDISASNRVKITSGENIRDGNFLNGMTDPAAWGKTLGQTLAKGLGADKWFDFSLLRSLLEIILRPVDGTLELKSYRYLLLQAGKDGVANIPYSSYNDGKKIDASALTGLRGREADLFVQIFVHIGEIVDKYVQEYVDFFNEFTQEYRAVKGDAHLHGLFDWEDGIVPPPNPILTTPENATEMVQYLFSETPSKLGLIKKLSYSPGKGAEYGPTVQGHLVTLSNKAAALKKHVEKYGDMFSELGKANNSWWKRWKTVIPKHGIPDFPSLAKTALETTDNQTEFNVCDSNLRKNVLEIENFIKKAGDTTAEEMFYQNLSLGNFDAWKKKTKRWAAFTILQACKNNASYFNTFTVEEINPAPAGQPDPYDANQPYIDDGQWTYYLSTIKLADKGEPGGIDKFVEGMVAGAISKSIDNPATIEKNIWTFEKNIWSESAVGEILFANDNTHTQKFKAADGTIERVSDAEFIDITGALAKLIPIVTY